MDIVTHAAIGLTLAGAFADRPEFALALLAGSVAPDLDVLSRLLGKRAMLRCHQTFSHSIPVLALLSFIFGAVPAFGMGVGIGLFLGGLLHVLLDYTNTLGVTLLWPFKKQRLHAGWVFFIDAWVMVVSFAAATVTVLWYVKRAEPSLPVAILMGAAFAAYWCWKALLHRRAKTLAGDGLVSLIPSALAPWHFYICSKAGDWVSVDLFNLRTGAKTPVSRCQIVDEEVLSILHQLPEWQLMRDLSPAYHAIKRTSSETGHLISCRDLRVRNFNSRFGDLDVQVDAAGTVTKTHFYV